MPIPREKIHEWRQRIAYGLGSVLAVGGCTVCALSVIARRYQKMHQRMLGQFIKGRVYDMNPEATLNRYNFQIFSGAAVHSVTFRTEDLKLCLPIIDENDTRSAAQLANLLKEDEMVNFPVEVLDDTSSIKFDTVIASQNISVHENSAAARECLENAFHLVKAGGVLYVSDILAHPRIPLTQTALKLHPAITWAKELPDFEEIAAHRSQMFLQQIFVVRKKKYFSVF